jgi:hypothetical protein
MSEQFALHSVSGSAAQFDHDKGRSLRSLRVDALH